MSEPPGFLAIVGAPRCGTTSLARFLGAHPKVRFSSVKEPHFFSRYDLRGQDGAELEAIIRDQYLARYFPEGAGGARLLAEGSVSYLYAAEQMLPILRQWPNARFVIALRDPLQMLPSLHRRLLYTGDEKVADFATAWTLIPERDKAAAFRGPASIRASSTMPRPARSAAMSNASSMPSPGIAASSPCMTIWCRIRPASTAICSRSWACRTTGAPASRATGSARASGSAGCSGC